MLKASDYDSGNSMENLWLATGMKERGAPEERRPLRYTCQEAGIERVD